MAQERPFLTEPDLAGESAAGGAPEALFDLAVNRAALVLRSVGRADALSAWHARTRFARRVSLDDVKTALASRPHTGEWHWAGGRSGAWQPGKAEFP